MILYLILVLYFFSISYIYMCAYFIWEKHDPERMNYTNNMYLRHTMHLICLGLLITYILHNHIIFSMPYIFFYITSAVLGYVSAFFIHCVHCYTYYNHPTIFICLRIISAIIFICLIYELLMSIIL